MKWRDFRRSGHMPTLVAAFLYFDVSFMVWVLMGAVATFVSTEFSLSATEKGLLTAIPLLGGALLRIPLGYLTDRFGGKRVGMTALLLTLIPLLVTWQWATTLNQLYALGFLLGIAGASFAVALPLASRWFPEKYQGIALGIAGAGNTGTLLATFFAPRISATFGWHAAFGFAALPVVLTWAVFLLLAKDSPLRPAPQSIRNYLRVASKLDLWKLCLLYALTFGGFSGLTTFLGIYFHDEFGVSKLQAADVVSLIVVLGSFLRPVGGYLSDRMGGSKVLVYCLSIAVGALALLTVHQPLVLTVCLLALTMAVYGMGNGAVFQLVPKLFRQEVGLVTGIVGAAGGMGGFLLPTMLGVVRDGAGSYGYGFGLFALVVFLGVLLSVQYERRFRRETQSMAVVIKESVDSNIENTSEVAL